MRLSQPVADAVKQLGAYRGRIQDYMTQYVEPELQRLKQQAITRAPQNVQYQKIEKIIQAQTVAQQQILETNLKIKTLKNQAERNIWHYFRREPIISPITQLVETSPQAEFEKFTSLIRIELDNCANLIDKAIDSIYYESIFFIFLAGTGDKSLRDSYLARLRNMRLVSEHPIETQVSPGVSKIEIYTMQNDPNKRYIQISIFTERALNERCPVFAYLSQNSKLYVSGHGIPEANHIETQDGNTKIPIQNVSQFIVNNIYEYSSCKFGSYMIPLKISFLTCSGGGLDSADVYKDAQGTLFHRANNTIFSLENTMAGRLLTGLRDSVIGRKIYAVIKARTTPMREICSPVYNEFKQIPDANHPNATPNYYPQTLQSKRAYQAALSYWYTQTGTLRQTCEEHSNQSKPLRYHGCKRKFQWDEKDRIKVTDLFNNTNVDVFFEVQKDRVMQYLALIAQQFNDTAPQANAVASASATINPQQGMQSKRKQLFTVVETIQEASTIEEILQQVMSIPKPLADMATQVLNAITTKLQSGELLPSPSECSELEDLYLTYTINIFLNGIELTYRKNAHLEQIHRHTIEQLIDLPSANIKDRFILLSQRLEVLFKSFNLTDYAGYKSLGTYLLKRIIVPALVFKDGGVFKPSSNKLLKLMDVINDYYKKTNDKAYIPPLEKQLEFASILTTNG